MKILKSSCINIIILFIVTFNITMSKVYEIGIEKEILNGNVKLYKYSIYEVKIIFGEPHKENLIQNILCEFNKAGKTINLKIETFRAYNYTEGISNDIYDSSGKLIETKFYDVNSNFKGCRKYIYNSNGLLFEELSYGADSILKRSEKYKYDSKGNCIEYTQYKDNNSIDKKRIFKFDERGNRIEDNMYRSDGSLYYKHSYKYNVNNKVIEEIFVNSKGEIENSKIISYDNNLNKIRIIELDKDYSTNIMVNWESHYEYDSRNNLIQDFRNKNGAFHHKTIYKYDINNNKIEEVTFNEDREITAKTISIYDDFNNLVKEINYDENDVVVNSRSFEYEYDSMNNWIKMVSFKNGIAETIEEREITYYE